MGATAIQVIHPRARRFVARHAVAQLILWSGFYYLMPALLPAMLADTGWSAITVSGAITAGFLLWAMLCPLAGNMVDRGNFGVAMRVAGAVGAALLLTAASTHSMAVACASLLLLGGPMAMTLYDPCFSVMIRRFGPGVQSRRAITSVTLVAGFATLVTFPAVAWMIAAGVGWRWVMALFAGMVLAAVLILPRDADDIPVPAKAANAAEGCTGKGRRTLAIGIAFALIMFGHALLLFQLPAQLVRAGGDATALMLPMVLGPAQIAGRLAWQAAQTMLRLEAAAIGLFGLMCLPPMILLLGDGMSVVLVALVVQGAGYGVHTILRPVLSAEWLPEAGFSRRLGVIAMTGLLMMAVAPLVGAWAAAAFGFAALLALVLLADLAGLMVLIVLAVRTRRGG